MKRILSLLIVCTMMLSMIPAMAKSAVKYIPAPYTVAEGTKVTDTYFEPVLYPNENGPTIGVTTLGVLKVDGLYFKDSDNDKELDIFEDWRLDAETRAADLVSKLTTEQQAGFAFNALFLNPVSRTVAEATDENGNIIPSKIMSVKVEGVEPASMYGISFFVDTDMTEKKVRSAVYRGGTAYEAAVVALTSNIGNQIAEYEAVRNGEANIPFILISNPINNGHADQLALAAAVMGDVANGGDYSMVLDFARNDAAIWIAQGIRQMYGPQIDIASDPRWVRINGTYGEVPEVVAGISAALVEGYQGGVSGVTENSVFLSIKHFPGDGSSENGYESHSNQGRNRIYSVAGSMEKYQLVAFQAACDAGVGSIMPCYSQDVTDPRSAEQTYKGVTLKPEEQGAAYNKELIGTLLRDLMGFNGFVNSDSGIMTSTPFGVEHLDLASRYGAVITAGTDVIGDYSGVNGHLVLEALANGSLTEDALDRASFNHALAYFRIGYFENPYVDPDNANAVHAANTSVAAGAAAKLSNQKSVVLLKNKGNVLPLNDTSKKVYIASFTGKGEDTAAIQKLTAEFTAKGFTVVEDEDEADVAYLSVVPTYNGSQGSNTAMGVLDLVEDLEVRELKPQSQEYSGELIDVCTLDDVEDIAELSEEFHARGGVVIGSITLDQPWILTNLEPYCDGLIAYFNNVPEYAHIDVVSGAFNPTGKLPLTLISCNEVIAVEMKTLSDGNEYEICASPNDVPGYDKDQYIDPAILEKVPGGSYAYRDSEGNYYKAWFGLSY